MSLRAASRPCRDNAAGPTSRTPGSCYGSWPPRCASGRLSSASHTRRRKLESALRVGIIASPRAWRRERPSVRLTEEARVQRVADRVPEQIRGEHDGRDGDPGEDREPPGDPKITPRLRKHESPLGGRWLRTEAQERERRDRKDRRRQAERGDRDHRPEHLRNDVRERDPQLARANAAGRLDEELVTRREHGAADDPREAGDAADADGDRDLLEPWPEDRHDDEREQDPRERELDINQAHEHAIHPSTAYAGKEAD